MLSLEDFKTALGKEADMLTEAEIERLNTLTEQLASALFNMWSTELVKKSKDGNQNEKQKVCNY